MASRRGQQRYEMPTAEPVPGHSQQRVASGYSGIETGPVQTSPSIYARLSGWAHAIDERLGELGRPLQPHLPLIGRLLVVSTFVEDVLRLITGFNIQVRYAWDRRGLPWIVAVFVVLLNLGLQVFGAASVITKRWLLWGVSALVADMLLQSLLYAHLVEVGYFLRNISLCGGLVLILSDVYARDNRANAIIPGLLRVDKEAIKDPRQQTLLLGRILLAAQFVVHIIGTRWTAAGAAMNVLSTIAVILVVIGFKARFSASLLAVLLLVQNIATNAYWSLSAANPVRDIFRFQFYQTLSIVGGLILLVNMGAGQISFDEKRKIY